jgi:hypothetical protein
LGTQRARPWSVGCRVMCSSLVGDALSYAWRLSRDGGLVPGARAGTIDEGTAAMVDASADLTTRRPGFGRTVG